MSYLSDSYCAQLNNFDFEYHLFNLNVDQHETKNYRNLWGSPGPDYATFQMKLRLCWNLSNWMGIATTSNKNIYE